MKNLYTARVKVTEGRDGSAVSSDGQMSVKLGFPKELGGAGIGANPEQLFVAGFASCFASTIKALASARSVKTGPLSIDAAGVLSIRDDGTYIVSHVTLVVHAPELGAAGPALLDEAKRFCAYSNATRGNVQTEVRLG